MIRFVDSENLEKDYLFACEFDDVYGTINSYLFRLFYKIQSGMFWNIYNEDSSLCGNLSFVNDTFTVCTKDEKSLEEIAQFVDFWGNFKFISASKRNVLHLDDIIKSPHKSTFGDTFRYNESNLSAISTLNICKDIDLYNTFSLLTDIFPNKMSDITYDSFYFDMNYRLRRNESYLFTTKHDNKITSIIEVICRNSKSVVVGFLGTRKEYRKQGLASSLLKFVSQEFPKCSIYILSDDENSSAFYKKLGLAVCTEWGQLTVL